MHQAVGQHLEAIVALCIKHGVQKLELFGSAARDDSDPNDFDFFVEFLDPKGPGLPGRWFGLQEDLEALLGKPVDLVSGRSIRNPYFFEVANKHRTQLYAA